MEVSAHVLFSAILLIFLGVLLIIAGLLLGFLKGRGRVSGGGVILIGPIPIIFGSKGALKYLAILGFIAVVTILFVYVVLMR